MAERARDGTAYALSGPEGGPLVVLIHGLGLAYETWDAFIPALARRYRVLTYHLLGHGDSRPPPRQPTLSLFSEQLLNLLDELGVAQAAIVGFSLGGMINRRFAIDHPDRVAALAILNSPHERSADAQRLVELRVRDTAGGGPAATLQASLERWFTPAFRKAHPETIERVGRRILANDPETYTYCRMVLASGVTQLIRPDPPIGVPALVMTCEHDSGSTPAMTRAIAAEIEGAEALVIPHLQHCGLIEEPQLFIEPLQGFLARALP